MSRQRSQGVVARATQGSTFSLAAMLAEEVNDNPYESWEQDWYTAEEPYQPFRRPVKAVRAA